MDRRTRKIIVARRYLLCNKKYISFAKDKEKRCPVKEKIIEVAHRHMIQQRMKRSGQRWTKDGLQQIANLRVASKSNQWDSVLNMIKMAA